MCAVRHASRVVRVSFEQGAPTLEFPYGTTNSARDRVGTPAAALATALYAGDESKANRSGSASLPDTLPHRPQWGRDGNGAIPAGD